MQDELVPKAESEPAHTILVVEDEVLVRMNIAERLREADFVVIEAVNADEAIEVLASNRDIGAVMTDIRMPGTMDGLELARLVRSRYPTIRILLTSGHLSAGDAVAHEGYFAKPYELDAVVIHIKELMK